MNTPLAETKKKGLVIVVDDNKITTKLLRRYLEFGDYEAIETYNGRHCLEKVAELKKVGKNIDLILVDLMMPVLDGYEFIFEFRKLYGKQTSLVMVTPTGDVSGQIKAIEAGADDYLVKPIEEKLLLAKTDFFVMSAKNERKISAIARLFERMDVSNVTMLRIIKKIILDFPDPTP